MAKEIGKGYSYKVIPIDLTNGLNEKEINANGEMVYYLEGNATLNVRINEPNHDQIPLRQSQRLIFPVTKLFISAGASAETIKLIVFHPKDAMFRGEEMIIASAVDTLADITKIGGTAQTGRDMVADIQHLRESVDGGIIAGRTDIAKDNSIANGTVIIHTVTAGKTFYLENAFLNVSFAVAGAGQYGQLLVRDDSDTLQYLIYFLKHDNQTGAETATTHFKRPIRIPAGWDICALSTTANVGSHAFIRGYEE